MFVDQHTYWVAESAEHRVGIELGESSMVEEEEGGNVMMHY